MTVAWVSAAVVALVTHDWLWVFLGLVTAAAFGGSYWFQTRRAKDDDRPP
jgi:hypothetical protein